MHPYLNTALKAARLASKIILKGFDRLDTLEVDLKKQHDFVTNIDKQSEEIILETLHKAYPDHGFLAEESGSHAQDAEHIWVIDPLDGTTNFVHGFPHFAISIALQSAGKTEHGLIYDPIRDELFTASRGQGAYLNSKRIRVRNKASMNGAFLATGSPRRDRVSLDVYFDSIKKFYPEASGIRRAGAATLDLAYVAAGRFDGFWERGLKPWDVAAGSLLVQEAGGLLGTFTGEHDFIAKEEIVAASPKIFKAMLQVLSKQL